jgi:hypothetical protein
MRKVKIASILLIFSLILISVGNFTIAQDSSYVGISEGEVYIWDLGLDQEGVNSLIDDSEIFVQELLDDLLTIDLGDYTDLNASEALLLGYEESFELINNIFPPGLIPDDWKTVNISTFMENSFDRVVETFNSSFFSGAIPYDWRSESIVDFFDHVIDGLNKTIPGFENFTLGEILENVINLINDNIPYDLLPEGWEDMTISNLIEISLGKPFDFINTTILPGMIPSDWLHMDLALLIQNIFPILPQWLINQFNGSCFGYYGEFSIFTIIDIYVQNFNYSMGGLIPGDWEDYTIPELVFPFLFGGNEDNNVSFVLDEFLEALNSTSPFDLYSVDMNYLINMTIYSMTYGLPIELQSMPTIDFLREQIDMMLVAFNSTYNPAPSEEPQPIGPFSFISFPDDWMSLTIDDLRAYYIDQIRTLFEQFMVQVDSYLEQFELLGGFDKLSLKAIIDHIGDEVELIPGGPKGVPINITIEIKVPMSDWVNLTDMLELDIFQYYQIYILDPTTFSVDTGALIEQFLSTAGLFIGNSCQQQDYSLEKVMIGVVLSKNTNFLDLVLTDFLILI